jgi:hypothetical protein
VLACGLTLVRCSPRGDDAPTRGVGTPKAAPSAESDAARDSQWRIVPGRSAGALTIESGEAELRRHYGVSAVDSTRIQLGEGETAPGTVLYPGDSLRRAEILWQDTVIRRRPARLVLRGNRSLWQVDRGISLGTSLQELEQLNGRPFTLAGFGWDYGGVVTDSNLGSLD